MRLLHRRALVAGASVVALLAAGLMAPAPAHASAAQGVISGSGAVTDDFADEATLSRTGPFRNSTAVALWQTVLTAEGFLEQSDIDCQFGPATEAATKSFQRRYGLSADGIVGPNTWAKADNYLVNDGQTPGFLRVGYNSPNQVQVLGFRRLGNGYYETFLDGGGLVWAVAYNTQASPYC
ncbi:Putative peptidoglycan binding domain-containing protein [Asanoa hainanensis]|uniref:Putative peptidoglycan binding domain-containing protein n=1 Tax=Asanoa hainanensis TaxID=560556 RepID=A0A239PFS9_9ACTN|nr:peptidoglycan-binding domain-containing protein [Asanoa hainanensis]SNT65977.1 Putative peptidoglycan binding domain-containing protein [Asanoa hainanensis]